MSLGAEGALLLTPNGGWHAAAPAILPVNSTGAGDALLAGFLAAHRRGPAERLAYAVSIGSSACLAEATAELPDDLIDSGRVPIRPMPHR